MADVERGAVAAAVAGGAIVPAASWSRVKAQILHKWRHLPITTPQGNWPTAIDLSTFSPATSITDTSFDTPFAV